MSRSFRHVFGAGYAWRYITEEGIQKIADTFKNRKEEDKFSKIVDIQEIVKNDYNISPSRYIQTHNAETYRPIGEIVEELMELVKDAIVIDDELKSILVKPGF